MAVTTARARSWAGRPLGRTARITLNVAAIVGLLCLVLGAVAFVTGVRPIIFQTGSMAPGIPAGALALTVPVSADDIRVGDVIGAPRAGDGKLVTHRVVGMERHGDLRLIRMRGDANHADDATPYDVTNGAQRLVWSVPGVGEAMANIRSPWLFVGLIALLALIAVPTRRATHRAKTRAEVSRATRAGEAPATDPDDPPRHRPLPAPPASR
ncbi:S26 family signal peptidase [Leifsonia sp. Le1]|uniref:S26 family signal peptidase n=1 Tax=Leifsonia sp. Le1 TaxID=3404918 RepID=UPI003EBFDDA2